MAIEKVLTSKKRRIKKLKALHRLTGLTREWLTKPRHELKEKEEAFLHVVELARDVTPSPQNPEERRNVALKKDRDPRASSYCNDFPKTILKSELKGLHPYHFIPTLGCLSWDKESRRAGFLYTLATEMTQKLEAIIGKEESDLATMDDRLLGQTDDFTSLALRLDRKLYLNENRFGPSSATAREAISDFPHWQEKALREALERQAYIEKSELSDSGKSVVMLGELLLGKGGETLHLGGLDNIIGEDSTASRLQRDPSSIPDEFDHNAESFFHLLPLRVGFNFNEGGTVIGYEPVIRLNRSFSLRIPVEFANRSYHRDGSFFNYGLLLSYDRPGASAISSVGVGPLHFHPHESWGEDSVGARVKIGFLADTFALNYQVRQRNEYWEDEYWTISIEDLNGIIYWAVRNAWPSNW